MEMVMEVTQQFIAKDQGFEEKREFLRIDIKAPVSFHTGSGQWQEAQGLNLSGQGILMESPIRLSV